MARRPMRRMSPCSDCLQPSWKKRCPACVKARRLALANGEVILNDPLEPLEFIAQATERRAAQALPSPLRRVTAKDGTPLIFDPVKGKAFTEERNQDGQLVLPSEYRKKGA